MHKYCIAMLLGAYTLGLFPGLPGLRWLSACCIAVALLYLNAQCRVIAIYLAGFAIMGIAANSQVENRLDADWQNNDWVITGQVEDFPDRRHDSMRFLFLPENSAALPTRIRLTWFEPEFRPRQGESWQLQVRLKRPRGLHNPGGFDFEGWAFRERIGATGYVIAGGKNRRMATRQSGVIARTRQRVADRIDKLFSDSSAAAVLMAIAIGARHNINRADWDRYAQTGTSHLMAISGLHIGLASGSVYCLVWLLQAPFCRTRNLRDTALVCATAAAGIYAQLAGFAVPAQRAFLMVLITTVALVGRHRFSGSYLLAIPAMTIFVLDPLSILTPGFQLSFCAVAILYYGAATLTRFDNDCDSALTTRALNTLRNTAGMQLALLFGLFSIVVLTFGRFSPIAPLLNAFVLPIFSFLIVPFTLFGVLLDGPMQAVGDLFLSLSHRCIEAVLMLIKQAAELPSSSFDVAALSPTMVAVAVLPPLYVILPRSWPGRRLPLIAILAVLFYTPPRPEAHCFRYSVLDVGQGLSVVLETRRHTLIFDTGPSFRDGGDSGAATLLPFLAKNGINRVDRIVVSHADLDHAGGLRSVQNGIYVDDIFVGEVMPEYPRQCRPDVQWRWDGVKFSFLHPRNPAAWEGNNRSCVLMVDNGDHRLLLTGDIEKPAELLLEHLDVLQAVNSVVVPHHGSGTSSSEALVSALQAEFAIVSAGYGNRWGMPRESVVARWQESGAKVLNTAHSGSVSQQLCAGNSAGPVQQQRLDVTRYWHDSPTINP